MSDSDSDFFADDDAVLEQRKAELLAQSGAGKTEAVDEDYVSDDAAFRAQFDRSSATFHGGITTPVPLGGSRVPAGMEDHANWQELPEQPVEEVRPDAYGPEFERIYHERQNLNDLKKAINVVTPFVAMVVANKKAIASSPDENERASAQKGLARSTKARAAALQPLKALVDKFDGTEWSTELKRVYDRLAKEDITEEEHPVTVDLAKKFIQRIARTQKNLLQDAKKAKKAFIDAQGK